MSATGSPLKDVRVRQGLNYCVDRAGLVSLLNSTAEPSVGWLKPTDAGFGKPKHRYASIPPRARRCWPRPATRPDKPLALKIMISTSGSGQMLPLAMNEFLQENLKAACGVQVEFDVVEWQILLNAARTHARRAAACAARTRSTSARRHQTSA